MTANTPPLLRLPVLSGIAAAVMFILPTGDTPNGGANLTTVPLDKLHLRESSPPMPSSRIDDFALLESSWAVFLSGFSNGRIAENDNQGTTFEAQFTADYRRNDFIQRRRSHCAQPRQPRVTGTGDNNHRQSSSPEPGVYQSTDGGKTWQNVGLRDTAHSARISAAQCVPAKFRT